MPPRLAAASVLLTTLLSGCVMYYRLRPGESRPIITMVAPAQRVAVWQRAVTVLLEEGFVPEVLNEAACYISARRRADIADDTLSGVIVLISVSPEGSLRIEAGGSGLFHSEEQFHSALTKLQSRLASSIAHQFTPGTSPLTG